MALAKQILRADERGALTELGLDFIEEQWSEGRLPSKPHVILYLRDCLGSDVRLRDIRLATEDLSDAHRNVLEDMGYTCVGKDFYVSEQQQAQLVRM
ncbi:hypothetical protein GF351_02215 [Candidatus Woesearchaeota archaeon]|nr:hypothetical protein [Candidatus Woesearchaeota archaeon]